MTVMPLIFTSNEIYPNGLGPLGQILLQSEVEEKDFTGCSFMLSLG